MKAIFLIFMLLLTTPFVFSTCVEIGDGYACEVDLDLRVERQGAHLSKDFFVKNLLFIILAIAAILFSFFGNKA